MRRARQPSIIRDPLEFPLRLVFVVGAIIIQLIIFVRRVLPVGLILLLCTLLPLIGFSMKWLDGLGSWLMLAAALTLMFAAGRAWKR